MGLNVEFTGETDKRRSNWEKKKQRASKVKAMDNTDDKSDPNHGLV